MSDLSPDELSRLTTFLSGEMSPDKAGATQDWIGQTAERQRMYEYLVSMRASLTQMQARRFNVDAMWNGVADRVGIDRDAGTAATPALPVSIARAPRRAWNVDGPARRSAAASGGGRPVAWVPDIPRAMIAVAVLVVGMIVAGVGLRGVHRTGRRAPVFAAERAYKAPIGARVSVTLADGSTAVLAPGSELRVGRGFGHSLRTVSLRGEALFTVRSGDRHPFVVATGTVTTRVLGTTFDVRHYAEDSAVHVSVIAGRVAAGRGRNVVTLSAGMMAQVTDSTVVSDENGDPRSYSAWASGTLVFTKVPVATMLATVGRWYGYQFRIADSALAAQHVTTVLTVDDPATLMSMLKDLLNVTMTFDGNVVTLHSRQRGHGSPLWRVHPARDSFTISNEVGK